MLPPIFIYIGTGIGAIGSVFYILDVLRGKVKPNKISFLVWSIAPFIAFLAQVSEGVGMESILTLSSFIFPFLIFLSSFIHKNAQWNIRKLDITCGVLSLVGLLLWMVTRTGDIAIAFSLLSDGLASLPTIIKSYKHPETESAWPWLATALGTTLILLTLTSYTFTNASFIIYVIMVNFIIFLFSQTGIGKQHS